MDTGFFQYQTVSTQQKMSLGVRISSVLDLSREDLKNTLNDIENSDIFRKLHDEGELKVIKIQPIKRFIAIKKEMDRDMGRPKLLDYNEPDIDIDAESIMEELLKKTDPLLYLAISSMSVDLFYYYFIEGEGTDREVAEFLRITPEKAAYAREVIGKALAGEALGYRNSASDYDYYYSCFEVSAEIYVSGEDLRVEFCTGRSRYSFDEEKLSQIVKAGRLTPVEIKKLKILRAKINLINSRFNLLHEIISRAISIQKKYLLTGDPADMQVLEEKELAAILGVDFSWVSRLVNGKNARRYVKFGSKFIALRDLFISRRELKKKLGKLYVKQILEENRKAGEGKSLSNEAVARILRERYFFTVSGRTVNNWVKELRQVSGK